MSAAESHLPAEKSGAIFISYTREDVAAAKRIAEALRASDLEVWFDQEDLRGGDAWDAKIKQQIRACTLFVAVISNTTQSRPEGYFRREWKFAAERTHDMAETVPFLLPVAIDETAEAGALVPAEFMRAQWTRLLRGLPTPTFVQRVQALLASSVPGTGKSRLTPSVFSDKLTTSSAPIAQKPSRRAGWVWGALVALVAAVVVFFAARKSRPAPPAAATQPAADASSASVLPAPPIVSDKSIAVLPFTNMSGEQENAFFADGVHEDILTNLANIADLRVVSRTSVMEYRGTTKKVVQIARELGVAYLLEGSVRRTGNKVRVVCQLIDGRTDQHVLAPDPYDRDLADIFAVQSELAKTIAAKLQAVLSPKEKARIDHLPTTSPAAYDLYLRARAITNTGYPSLDTSTRAVTLLEGALELDPKFADAWRSLVNNHIAIARRVSAPEAHWRQAKEAAETMERLAPDDPNTWVTLSIYHRARGDDARAQSYLRRASEAVPNNGFIAALLGDADKREGRAREALENYRHAYALDPQHPSVRRNYGEWLIALRLYDEAARIERENPKADGSGLAQQAFVSRGSTREMEQWLEAHPDTNPDIVADWKFITGAAGDYLKLLDDARRKAPGGVLPLSQEEGYLHALVAIGESERARTLAIALVAKYRANGVIGPGYASALALSGDRAGALAMLSAWQEEDRQAGRKRDFLGSAWAPPFILLEAGEKEKAIAEFARLLRVPSGLNVHFLRHSWGSRSLLGDPAFEALLNDPKNNAPLL